MIVIGGQEFIETFDERVMYLACEFVWALDMGFVDLDPETFGAYQTSQGALERAEDWQRGDDTAPEFGRLALLLRALETGAPLDDDEIAAGKTRDGYTLAEARQRLRIQVVTTVERDEKSVRQWIEDANA